VGKRGREGKGEKRPLKIVGENEEGKNAVVLGLGGRSVAEGESSLNSITLRRKKKETSHKLRPISSPCQKTDGKGREQVKHSLTT